MRAENEYGDLGSLLRDRARRSSPSRPDFTSIYARAGELSVLESGRSFPGSGSISAITGIAGRWHRILFALSCAAALSCAVGLGFVAGRLFRTDLHSGLAVAPSPFAYTNPGAERDFGTSLSPESFSSDALMEEYIDFVRDTPPRSGLSMTVRYDVGLYLSDLWSAGDGVLRY